MKSNSEGLMIDGIVSYIDRDNIDTDQIIPARFLKTPRSTDHGQFLFHDMRRGRDGNLSEDFILNQKEFMKEHILI